MNVTNTQTATPSAGAIPQNQYALNVVWPLTKERFIALFPVTGQMRGGQVIG